MAIFEQAAQVRHSDSGHGGDALVRAWLLAIAALVLAMVVVGGATRLTGSGLSITEWRPILGAIPPLSEADWQAAFEKYRQIAQFKLVNASMTLAEFKPIYWWEWSHRLLGRSIGVLFAVPLAWFWWSGKLRPGYPARLLTLLLLGGLQGYIGWFMVQSGLTGNRVAVSELRLALHLILAFVVLGALVWLALGLSRKEDDELAPELASKLRPMAIALPAAVLFQTVLGALVAGTSAGRAHNTWPLMDGQLIPEGMASLSPWYVNLYENVTTVQFNHRLMAYVLLAMGARHVWAVLASGAGRRVSLTALYLAAALVGQVGLGIWTLLEAVPLGLGLAHQGAAAVVFAIAIAHLHALSRSPS